MANADIGGRQAQPELPKVDLYEQAQEIITQLANAHGMLDVILGEETPSQYPDAIPGLRGAMPVIGDLVSRLVTRLASLHAIVSRI